MLCNLHCRIPLIDLYSNALFASFQSWRSAQKYLPIHINGHAQQRGHATPSKTTRAPRATVKGWSVRFSFLHEQDNTSAARTSEGMISPLFISPWAWKHELPSCVSSSRIMEYKQVMTSSARNSHYNWPCVGMSSEGFTTSCLPQGWTSCWVLRFSASSMTQTTPWLRGLLLWRYLNQMLSTNQHTWILT